MRVARLGIRDVLARQAQLVGASFVDPIAEGWLTNSPELIGADHVHPNDAGQVFLARQIGPHLKAALSAP
jgi:lysophospholipase L1-like esterase